MAKRNPHLDAARIIQDAGGQLIGRTRLQKVAYLTQLAGFGDDFDFEYRHYGPFSEDLARGIEIASAFGQVVEEERRAEWGGWYSIYRLPNPMPPADTQRADFVRRATAIGAVELELAATAAFLYTVEGVGRTTAGNPWEETRLRKPEKARDGRLERAAVAYETLRQIHTPSVFPHCHQSSVSIRE